MYSLDTYTGRIMSGLRNYLEEGDYSEAAALAEKIIAENPSNEEALSSLASVYEKMADACREGGDGENEKVFLQKSLALYLKLLVINPNSESDRIKKNRIKRRLTGERSESFSDDIKEKTDILRDRFSLFMEEKFYPFMKTKAFRFYLTVFCILIAGLAVWSCFFTKYIPDSENPSVSVSSSETETETPGEYKGPTDTIIIENDNAKAERYEKEMEEAYAKQQKENGSRESVADRGYSGSSKSSVPQSSQKTKAGLKPFKVPFTDLELKSPEDMPGNEIPEKKEEEKTAEEVKSEPKEPVQEKPKTNYNLKRADALLAESVRAYSGGNKSAAKQKAKEAKDIYNQELSMGNSSRRIRSNIETADTILGDN